MRQVYLVSYDICDPKRLRKVFKTMRGFGDPMQLSVFRSELSALELVELREALRAIINAKEDQVLFVDLGPVDGRGDKVIRSMGRPYVHPERHAMVI